MTSGIAERREGGSAIDLETTSWSGAADNEQHAAPGQRQPVAGSGGMRPATAGKTRIFLWTPSLVGSAF